MQVSILEQGETTMTLTEGVIVLNRLTEKFAISGDFETLQHLSFVIKQIKDEQNKKRRKF